jgi:hypothetical protein
VRFAGKETILDNNDEHAKNLKFDFLERELKLFIRTSQMIGEK